MRRLTWASLLAIGLAVTSWGCKNDTTGSPTTTTPTVTESFNATLTPNGGQTFQFSTTTSGTVTATLTTLSPDTTTAVGLALGVWNNTQCQITVANDKAVQGSVVVGTASGAGSVCARVYDVGNLTASESVVVTVIHP